MENTSDNRQQSIIDAVSYRDAAKLEQLLRTTDNPVLDFHWGYSTPLVLAVMKKEYVLVEKLLHSGASANFPNDIGYTPLMLAAIDGSMDICNLLLKMVPMCMDHIAKSHMLLYIMLLLLVN